MCSIHAPFINWEWKYKKRNPVIWVENDLLLDHDLWKHTLCQCRTNSCFSPSPPGSWLHCVNVEQVLALVFRFIHQKRNEARDLNRFFPTIEFFTLFSDHHSFSITMNYSLFLSLSLSLSFSEIDGGRNHTPWNIEKSIVKPVNDERRGKWDGTSCKTFLETSLIGKGRITSLKIILIMMQFRIEGKMGEIDLDTAQVAEIGRVVFGDF